MGIFQCKSWLTAFFSLLLSKPVPHGMQACVLTSVIILPQSSAIFSYFSAVFGWEFFKLAFRA